MVSELLSNVAKHSGATAASVAIRTEVTGATAAPAPAHARRRGDRQRSGGATGRSVMGSAGWPRG